MDFFSFLVFERKHEGKRNIAQSLKREGKKERKKGRKIERNGKKDMYK